MPKRILSILSLLVVALLVGCGGANDTYSPTFQGPAGPSFRLAAAPQSNTVTPGQSASYTVTATSIAGFDSSVDFSISGLPAGATATFNPASVVPSSGGTNTTLTVTTSGGGNPTPAGTYTLTITGTGGNITQQTTVTLVVSAGAGGLNGTIQ